VNTVEQRRAGYVALVGRTNAGKSTFLNAVLEAKAAIISDRPQTTRKRILGVKTSARGQIVFFDSPGIHKPLFKLNDRMMKEVHGILEDADVVLYFIDVNDDREDEFVLSLLRQAAKPTFLLINKIDTVRKSKILERIDKWRLLFPWREIVPISALKMDNVDRVLDLVLTVLPVGEYFYPEDACTFQSEKHYVAELIREQLLGEVRDELPFATTVVVEEITDKGRVIFVRAEVYVETQSQKKIIIGRHGSLTKRIGEGSRRELEEYFGKQVFIDLFIKVVPDWRNSSQFLQQMFDS